MRIRDVMNNKDVLEMSSGIRGDEFGICIDNDLCSLMEANRVTAYIDNSQGVIHLIQSGYVYLAPIEDGMIDFRKLTTDNSKNATQNMLYLEEPLCGENVYGRVKPGEKKPLVCLDLKNVNNARVIHASTMGYMQDGKIVPWNTVFGELVGDNNGVMRNDTLTALFESTGIYEESIGVLIQSGKRYNVPVTEYGGQLFYGFNMVNRNSDNIKNYKVVFDYVPEEYLNELTTYAKERELTFQIREW